MNTGHTTVAFPYLALASFDIKQTLPIMSLLRPTSIPYLVSPQRFLFEIILDRPEILWALIVPHCENATWDMSRNTGSTEELDLTVYFSLVSTFKQTDSNSSLGGRTMILVSKSVTTSISIQPSAIYTQHSSLHSCKLIHRRRGKNSDCVDYGQWTVAFVPQLETAD